VPPSPSRVDLTPPQAPKIRLQTGRESAAQEWKNQALKRVEHGDRLVQHLLEVTPFLDQLVTLERPFDVAEEPALDQLLWLALRGVGVRPQRAVAEPGREPAGVAVPCVPERVSTRHVVIRGLEHGMLKRPVGEHGAPQGDPGERLDIAVSPPIVGQALARLSPQ
jgi:hypothetical protein